MWGDSHVKDKTVRLYWDGPLVFRKENMLPRLNGAAVEVWEWKIDFVPNFTGMW